jgi:phosphoribosylformylglycinamidine cyclo-ligase
MTKKKTSKLAVSRISAQRKILKGGQKRPSSPRASGWSYAQAGVDRDRADRLVGSIAAMAQPTLNAQVKSTLGGYASLYELSSSQWLAASTDGVGTKLKLAFALEEHSTIGIDLVAMSVNDLLCVGAKPLFFLDYFATGKLRSYVAKEVLKGIVKGCGLAGCALVGGETAEMPEFYQPGEYDLGGFAVGSLHPTEVLPKPAIQPGMTLIGLASSGLHSNGFSLVRKLLPPISKAPRNSGIRAQYRECLTPTQIYVSCMSELLRQKWILGAAHITGSGFLNVPRISTQVDYQITLPAPRLLPPVFEWLKQASGLDFSELAQTFNLGLGMILVVDPSKVETVLSHLHRCDQKAWVVGQTLARSSKKSGVSRIALDQFGTGVRTELTYD